MCSSRNTTIASKRWRGRNEAGMASANTVLRLKMKVTNKSYSNEGLAVKRKVQGKVCEEIRCMTFVQVQLKV